MVQDFKEIQQQWASWLRDPNSAQAPEHADKTRLNVYSRLVHNNIENFIERGFPVLKQVLSQQQWHMIMHDFVQKHRAITPLFANIGNEFVSFLQTYLSTQDIAQKFPDFTYQLACYERMEVDAYNCQLRCQLPATQQPLACQWAANPSIQWRDFNFPVHTISAHNMPESPLTQPIFIAVYRVDTIDDKQRLLSTVKFLQLNPATMLLLDLVQQQPGLSLQQLSAALAEHLPQLSAEQIEQGLLTTIPDLYQRAMLFPTAN